MRIANAPAKKNIRRWRAHDRLEEQINEIKNNLNTEESQKSNDNSVINMIQKRLNQKLKELAILKERMVDGDFAATIKNKKYRGAR